MDLQDLKEKVVVSNSRSDERVDVRGVHPTYIKGMLAVPLVGKPRTISVSDAREVAKALLG